MFAEEKKAFFDPLGEMEVKGRNHFSIDCLMGNVFFMCLNAQLKFGRYHDWLAK